jgi:hypothetical protein
MNTTVLLFLLLCSSGVFLILFIFFVRIIAAGIATSREGDPWKQSQSQFTELITLVDQYAAKYYCLRLPRGAYQRLNYKLIQWQEKFHHLDRDEREKADNMREQLYQKASSAGIRLSGMYD